MKQPDFQQLFVDTFGSKPQKIRYRARFDSNLEHDLLFLSSLLHDARFLLRETSVSRQRLILKVERDCWERGVQPGGDGTLLLHNSLATLRIGPVRDVRWSVDHGLLAAQDELLIRSLYRFRDPADRSGSGELLILEGHDWHASICLEESTEPLIQLQDSTVPALWSEISSNPSLVSMFRHAGDESVS